MSAPGWIKIHRALLDHWCATEPEALAVWVRLLCEANFEDKKSLINGCLVEVKRGQLVFGLDAFSLKSGVSVMKLRRIISMLESDGMINRQKTSKYSLISIVCYDKYQEDNRQTSGYEQAKDNQITAPKEVKNLRRKEDLLSCEHDDAIRTVIDRINEITGQNLQPSAKVHRENISARLNDGFSLEDLISIVETKSAEWMGTKQQVYLVPKTLFRPSNFDRYLAESMLASKVPTAEQLVELYHEKMPSMPSVGVITPKRRSLVTDFCLSGKMTVDKFSAYLDYIVTRCTWVMNPRYGYGFDFLIDRDTLDKARNTTLEDRIND